MLHVCHCGLDPKNIQTAHPMYHGPIAVVENSVLNSYVELV